MNMVGLFHSRDLYYAEKIAYFACSRLNTMVCIFSEVDTYVLHTFCGASGASWNWYILASMKMEVNDKICFLGLFLRFFLRCFLPFFFIQIFCLIVRLFFTSFFDKYFSNKFNNILIAVLVSELLIEVPLVLFISVFSKNQKASEAFNDLSAKAWVKYKTYKDLMWVFKVPKNHA